MFSRILLAPENEGRNGSTTTNQETENEETAKPLTHEAVHGAISDRFKRFESKLEQRLSKFDSIEQRLSKLDQLDTLLERFSAEKPVEPAKAKESEEYKHMKSEAEKLRKRMEAMEAERAAEKAQHQQNEERGALQRALTSAGITDARMQRLATTMLYTEEKRVARDSEGRIVFKSTDKYGDPVDVDLEEGIKQWSTTEDAKGFLPPREVRGSGTKPSSARAGAVPKNQTKQERVREANETIFEEVRKAFTGG